MEIIPRPEHPDPIFAREEWFNLNGTWGFQLDPDNLGLRDGWQRLTAMEMRDRITVPFSWASPLSGQHLDDYKGVAWYGREVIYTPSLSDDRIWLRFLAVDYACTVYINGVEIGEHVGGYGAFEFDVTDLWIQEDSNQIVLRVEDFDRDDQTRGKQGYGEIRGIWQTVILESRPRTYMKRLYFETAMDGRVKAHAEVYAGIEEASMGVWNFEFGDMRVMQPVRLGPGLNALVAAFEVDEPVLWSPENPHLYEGSVSISDGAATDIVHTYFGIREIGYTKFDGRDYPWITLNGKPVYLNGTLDQSFNPAGYFTLPSEADVVAEVERLKALGLNMVRIHIKPEEPRKLYWLDRLGVMVFYDMCCFWGDPTPDAQHAWKMEMYEAMGRDMGHPAIVAWILFNETWGLFTQVAQGCKAYLPETRRWVRDMVREARSIDPTRLIEDNSACNYDHISETDLDTWHFYLNGYRIVRDHVRNVVMRSVPGSGFNFVPGESMPDVPLMNSECGMVWGVENSAGDSDIAWHYRYMLNEFRLHEKLCGFVFTEFHDVVNEFNGYYRIDNCAKDFGYGDFVEGMTVKDLHAGDFVAIDAPPCQTLGAGETVRVPLKYSGFGMGAGRQLALRYELWYDSFGERVRVDAGSIQLESGWGVTDLMPLLLQMPEASAVAVLALRLFDGERVVSRNFVTFDVRGPRTAGISIAPRDLVAEGFDADWASLSGHKRCGAGAGSLKAQVDVTQLRGAKGLEIAFEASSKRLLRKDITDDREIEQGNFMWGYKMDPGENENSYLMTDETGYPGAVQVLADGRVILETVLDNDPADSRGVLSWHYQEADRYLDEAGSYGYWVKAQVPEEIAKAALERGEMVIEFRAKDRGIAIYGRNAGRYPVDVVVRGT